MRALVLGGSGLVGSNLLARLIKDDLFDEVRVSVSHNKVDHQFKPNVECCYGDLRDRHFCNYIAKDVDIVFHCAAYSVGAAGMAKNPLALVTPNVVMSAHMLEAAYNAGVSQFIWLASTTGYPYIPGQVMTEEDMYKGEPHDCYYGVGWMKRYVGKLCELYATKLQKKMNCVILAPTNVYGPGDKYDFETCHVLPSIIRRFAEGQNPLEMWGKCEETRDFIYVDDMVEAIIKAIHCRTFELINIGSGTQFSILSVIDMMKRITQTNPEIVHLSDKPAMIPSREVSIVKAQKVIDFTAKTSLYDGLTKTFNWYISRHPNVFTKAA